MTESVLLIESVENNSTGTGFVVHQDECGIYVVTCRHVCEELVRPMVNGIEADQIIKGEYIDLAILHISGLQISPLMLQKEVCSGTEVKVIGFRNFIESYSQKNQIKATLEREPIELHQKRGTFSYEIYPLHANEGFSFARGNSGSPVICQATGKVVAVVSFKKREQSHEGYAVDIDYLEEIWKDAPQKLFDKRIDSQVLERVSEKKTEILAHQYGRTLTGEHFYIYQRFVEFLLNRPLNESEKLFLQERVQELFMFNPDFVLNDIHQGSYTLMNIDQLYDEVQRGIARHNLMTQLYLNNLPLPIEQRSLIYNFVSRFIPPLAHDFVNGLVLTERDFQSWIEYQYLLNEIYDLHQTITPQQIALIKREIIQNYQWMPLAQKQSLNMIKIWNLHMQKIWYQMSDEEKRQFKQREQHNAAMQAQAVNAMNPTGYQNYLANMYQNNPMQGLF